MFVCFCVGCVWLVELGKKHICKVMITVNKETKPRERTGIDVSCGDLGRLLDKVMLERSLESRAEHWGRGGDRRDTGLRQGRAWHVWGALRSVWLEQSGVTRF